MNLRPISISWPLVCFFITFTFSFCSCHQADFTVDVSINCGSTGASAAGDGRQWLGDVRPRLSPLLQLGGLSAASTAIRELDPAPHKTARISRSLFSYSLQWNPGQKIIRLHFNPTLYRGFEGSRDFFTVEAGPFTLLANFSASLTAHALGVNTFVKEFCLNIEENQQLTLTFSPETSQFIDTYAFINGIEIVSVPASLSYFDGGEIGHRVVGQKSPVYVDDSTALEIVHRLNIKQDPVPATGDFYGVFPKWAKQRAHKLKSKTWKMPVEVGFRYLIRLHLSEAGLKTAGSGGSMFKILINEMVALTSSERGNVIVLIRDYMVAMRGRKRDISISLHELADGHGVLAGFEIVKLSNADDSLASPNPLPPPHVSRSHSLRLRDLLLVLGYHNAGATAAVAVISVLSIAVHKLREISEARSTVDKHNPSATAERRCRCFSLAEIQSATRNFNGSLVIGRGGFGKVYKGHIDNGSRTVAVKRLTSWSRQGGHEFRTEIETLSKLRHRNLVSLIGYCSERQEMILVYEYMARGTLADHLYKRGTHTGNINSPLTWKQRLNICIGTARGLDYLHTGHRVIHRDVKTTNILLDENLVAKVSDFGLAKPEDRSKSQSQSHIITKVKGTVGYLDPHYFNTQKLSRKSDIYAMGVVLLEALCGRRAMDSYLVEGEQILRVWARDKISRGEVDQIVDSTLRGEISANSLEVFVEIAVRCLHEEPKKRPTMAQVVVQLESAVEQQESKKQAAATPNKMHPVTHEVCPDYEAIQSFEKVSDIEVQNLTRSPKGKTNHKLIYTSVSKLWSRKRENSSSKENELLLSEIREANVDLTIFDWRILSTATKNFSSSKKVGEGGFGPVYKGVLPTRKVVAVKRRSESPTQSLEEFKNEILLLPSLHHQNIIKLLGYCIHSREKLIVYEFMENKSVDTFLDDVKKQKYFPWSVRFNIIKGIARGLVYLHQDSGLRVIHGDPKSSNILLDHEMNPKISDFGFSRTLLEHQSELETGTAAGTPYFISPERLKLGRVSVKSDVYSFGVVILEIVSGQSAWRSYEVNKMNLDDYARKLRSEGKVVQLVDGSLVGAFPADEVQRCIQVGLRCTLEHPDDRPTMPSVLKMLEGDAL